MLADEIIDLDEPHVDVHDSPEGCLLFASPPRALKLQARELKLMHVPLIGMGARPKHGGERLDSLDTSRPDTHDLRSLLDDRVRRLAGRSVALVRAGGFLEVLQDYFVDCGLKSLPAVTHDLRR
jgi:hypothetical protein